MGKHESQESAIARQINIFSSGEIAPWRWNNEIVISAREISSVNNDKNEIARWRGDFERADYSNLYLSFFSFPHNRDTTYRILRFYFRDILIACNYTSVKG